MSRSGPDYSNFLSAAPVHRVDDMGELAVRLGSPDSFNRAGNVIFAESFEFGMQRWVISGGVGDGSIGLTPDRYRSGPYSLEIVPRTTGSYQQWIYGRLSYPDSDTIGIEASFTARGATSSFDLCMWIYDGTDYKQCEIRYDHVNNKLHYLNSDGAWAELADNVNLLHSFLLFHTLKFVVDIDSNQYKRVIIDSVDMTGLSYGFSSTASAINAHIQPHIRIYATDNSQPEHYVDDIIITVNEP